MIIIYNLAGLVIGAAGVFLGFVLIAVTGKLGPGVLALAMVWLVLGFMWRSWKTPPGQRRPYPSVFFIPLPFLAIPIVPLAILLLLLELTGIPSATGPGGATAARDSRAASFKDDERSLGRSPVGGDAELSQYLATALASNLREEAKADKYHVFTRVNSDSVLVLVKAPNLKSYKEPARVQLLQIIANLVSERQDLKEKKVYIAIKGNLTFGAIQVPPGRVQTGSVVLTEPLYDFYGPPPGAPPVAPPASVSAPGPASPSPKDAAVPGTAPAEDAVDK
jgi:hypothetical protein